MTLFPHWNVSDNEAPFVRHMSDGGFPFGTRSEQLNAEESERVNSTLIKVV